MSRVAVVTGAASGIGRATATRLRELGLSVASLDLEPVDGPDGIEVDIAEEASVARAIAQVRERFGPVEVLVNAAGVAAGGTIDGDDFVATWNRTIAVNLTGALLVVRACLPDLIACGSGRIVNVASTEALSAGRWTTPYTVSKHGLLGFTRSLAVELAAHGVTANCVCPGATLTGMTAPIPAAARDKYAQRNIPVGRYGRPEEIAYVIAALTDVEASFVNGAVIPVDGGMTAKAP